MVAIELGYPKPDVEERIIVQEARIDQALAQQLVRLGQAIRALKDEGLAEGASTRTLIATALLIKSGIAPHVAADVAIAAALSDDPVAVGNLRELSRIYMGAA
jgi:nitric oxide reductase NorQ protein